MTTARQERCAHCRSPYIFHPSFYGGDEINYPHNHHAYCPDCYKVVKASLAEVPAKYEKRWVPADNYTREQIVAHQEERCKTGLSLRRIFPGMIDMTGRTRHEQVAEAMPDGEWYKAEWWTHEPDKVSITRETWCEL